MVYAIEVSQLFQDAFRLLPKDRAEKITERVEILRDNPYPPGLGKKRLIGPKNPTRYRIRSGKYRLVYSIDTDTVHLWNVDTRANIYARHTESGYESTGPVDWDKIDEDDPDIQVLEPTPEPGEDWDATREKLKIWVESEATAGTPVIEETPLDIDPAPLPRRVTHELLRRIGIPRRFHKVLAACRTDVDLLEAISLHRVPAEIVDRVFNVVAEFDYDRVVIQPRKQVKQVEDLMRFWEGTLCDFQVTLDQSQKQLAEQIVRTGGPWLISGAAGTGKSTILLEAAVDLCLNWREKKRPRVLVTTFTNALVRGLKDQVECLFPDLEEQIDIRTTDDVMREVLEARPDRKQLKKDPSLQGLLRPITREILAPDYEQASLIPAQQDPAHLDGEVITLAPLTGMSWQYLLDEIETVIVGRNMRERDDYLTAPRPGRRVGLNETQRLRIWDISEALSRELHWHGWTTWNRRRQYAADLMAQGTVPVHYDAVFIDEAQDLQPNAVRMLVDVARSAKYGVRDLYLSADANQTIYGSGVSWVSVHPELKLTGRSRRLGTNHRSTRQIIEAARAYLRGAELDDEEATVEHRHVGPPPAAIHDLSAEDEIDSILHFLRQACGDIRRDLELCAVLVPSERDGKRVQAQLAEAGAPARFMPTREIDLGFEGVKILTRHAAKGLEFPIVALSLVNSVSKAARDGDESREARQKERRINYMAMTRAMRSLLVTLPEDADPELVAGIAEPQWGVERAT